MVINVRKIRWWSGRIESRDDGLAALLAPLEKAGVSLEAVVAKRNGEDPAQQVVFVTPVAGEAAEKAAGEAGFRAAPEIISIRVEGEDHAGIVGAMARTLAAAGIRFRAIAATAMEARFVCYLAFDSDDDANKAADLIAAPPSGSTAA